LRQAGKQQTLSSVHRGSEDNLLKTFKKTLFVVGCIAACTALADPPAPSSPTDLTEPNPWWSIHASGNTTVNLYFFWTETCPHCQRAQPDIADLSADLPWLQVQSLPLTGRTDNGRIYVALANSIGQNAQSVPAFLFCGQLLTGYDSRAGIGADLRRKLDRCKATLDDGRSPLTMPQHDDHAGSTELPILGRVYLSTWSLPAVAVALGLVDSFNPCAFFVLLFLLSMLVNARSRLRMLLIGGVFVAVSGLIYFVFMAAWLNLFLLVGQIFWFTLIAGLLAVAIGAINVKDFFWFGRGATLGIPADARTGLFKRMRTLLGAESLSSMLVGTVVLAVLANSYELLCTAGLPMVFTRILTLNALPGTTYYAYIGLYCIVYVLPLLAIVTAFAWTLGRRKLSEYEGRVLKLLSGLMMSGLGLLLMFNPEALNSLATTMALLGTVGVTTYVLHRFAHPAST